jgi:hypothetical protein
MLQVGRIKQKRGYKDQWPYNIKIYTDESGKNKGDACLAYEDPSAAHSASGFYNSMLSLLLSTRLKQCLSILQQYALYLYKEETTLSLVDPFCIFFFGCRL